MAVIEQPVARRSHNPKVVSSILTHRIVALNGRVERAHGEGLMTKDCREQHTRIMPVPQASASLAQLVRA